MYYSTAMFHAGSLRRGHLIVICACPMRPFQDSYVKSHSIDYQVDISEGRVSMPSQSAFAQSVVPRRCAMPTRHWDGVLVEDDRRVPGTISLSLG